MRHKFAALLAALAINALMLTAPAHADRWHHHHHHDGWYHNDDDGSCGCSD